jgi:hypothetical protein
MPQPMPENTRDKAIQKIREARQLLKTIQLMESAGGHQKSASERVADQTISSESQLLLKEAFALGPAGRQCPQCGGSGRV